jgi:hypothetical protein
MQSFCKENVKQGPALSSLTESMARRQRKEMFGAATPGEHNPPRKKVAHTMSSDNNRVTTGTRQPVLSNSA